jgi:hypothetical protein
MTLTRLIIQTITGKYRHINRKIMGKYRNTNGEHQRSTEEFYPLNREFAVFTSCTGTFLLGKLLHCILINYSEVRDSHSDEYGHYNLLGCTPYRKTYGSIY